MSDMSRKEAIENLETLKAFLEVNGVFTVSDAIKNSIDFAISSLETDEAYQLMEEQPKADKPTIIDWNNCHTPEQLDSIATTKNDLGVDAVSRADARSLICNTDIKHHMFGVSRKAFKDLYNGIDELPSVTPIRPKGHWIEQNDDYYDWYECSECGYGSEGEMQYSSEYDVRTKYCPNCGAKMVEPQESGDKE